jgi:hypothetical protein
MANFNYFDRMAQARKDNERMTIELVLRPIIAGLLVMMPSAIVRLCLEHGNQRI